MVALFNFSVNDKHKNSNKNNLYNVFESNKEKTSYNAPVSLLFNKIVLKRLLSFRTNIEFCIEYLFALLLFAISFLIYWLIVFTEIVPEKNVTSPQMPFIIDLIY